MATKITVNNLRVSDKEGNLKAFCSVDIAGKVEIFSCKLMEGQNGMWVAFPQRKGKDEKWYDNVKIKDDDLKKCINDAVIEAYEQATGAKKEEDFGAESNEF